MSQTYKYKSTFEAFQEKVVGDLNLELAEHYKGLIKRKVLPAPTISRDVFFDKDNVIKVSSGNFDWDKERLWNEFKIGRGLENIGLNVPRMYGVYFGDEISFLVMSRLNIIELNFSGGLNLTSGEINTARTQFDEQVVRAERFGYHSSDVHFDPDSQIGLYFHNCGFNRDDKKLYFFDFGRWEEFRN